MKKAWYVTYDGTMSVVAAETPGKARLIVANVIHELWGVRRWTEITVRRARKHDAWAATDRSGAARNELSLP
jgi:hypothetical protein